MLRNLIADTRRHKIDGEGLQRTENWCGRQKNQEWLNRNKFQNKNRRRNNRKIWNNIRQQMDELRIHCGDAKQTFIENQLEKGQLEKFGWRHDKHLLDHEEWLEASIINNFHNQQLKAEY